MFGWIEAVFLFLALAGLGVGMLSLPQEPDIVIARFFFIAAAIVLAAKVVWWGLKSKSFPNCGM
jgi:hypothetical protein